MVGWPTWRTFLRDCFSLSDPKLQGELLLFRDLAAFVIYGVNLLTNRLELMVKICGQGAGRKQLLYRENDHGSVHSGPWKERLRDIFWCMPS